MICCLVNFALLFFLNTLAHLCEIAPSVQATLLTWLSVVTEDREAHIVTHTVTEHRHFNCGVITHTTTGKWESGEQQLGVMESIPLLFGVVLSPSLFLPLKHACLDVSKVVK